MRTTKLFLGVMVSGTLAMGPVGCDKTGASGAASAEADTTPAGLGKAAGKIYVDAMKAIVRDLEAKPAADVAKAKVTALFDDAKKQLIAIGKQREAMTAADKGKFDQAVTGVVTGVDRAVFEAYGAIQTHYSKTDLETGNLIADINAVTRYANYDLLREQLPEEAKELGILK